VAAEVVVKFIGDSKSFDRAAGRVSSKLGSLGRAAGAAVLGLGAAGTAFGVASLNTFGNFDQAMTESLAIMGDVSSTMKGEMSDAAREIGLTTQFSATQAAESFFFLASAGLSAEQSIAALPQVAAFAQAGAFDMALATDLLTDAQSALGLTVEDSVENLENMTRVSDVLVGANTLANASVEQFSAALTNRAGPAMRAVGMEVEEGVAVLAAFADQGIKGEVAGNQLAIVMRDLSTKALTNKDAFEQMGIAVYDSEGEFNNMGDIISDLEGSLEGMSDAQQKATLLALGFSDRSVAALTTLLGTSDAIKEYEDALMDAGGTTKTVADKQLESFNAQMGLIKARLEDFMITVGSKLAPLVLKAFKKMDEFWAIHGESIMEGFRKMRDLFLGVVGKIRSFWDENGDGIMSKARIMAQQVWEVIQRYWPQIRDTIESVMTSVQSVIQSVIDIVTGIWDRWGENIMRVAKKAFEYVLAYIEGAWKIIDGIFKFFAGLIEGDWGKMWDGIVLIIEGAWGIIKAALDLLLTLMWELLKAGWGVIKGIFKDLMKAAGDGLSAGWFWVSAKLSQVVGWIGDKAGDFLEAGKTLGRKIIDGVKSGVSGVVGFATTLATSVKNALKSAVNTGIIDKINSGISGLQTAFNSVPFFPDISLPRIPRLARGGFVDVPTLAMVGDSPGEGEIVSPESMMRKVVREEAGGSGATINIYVEGTNASPEEIAEALTFARRAGRF
jgi:TP901 family phage tail tape measure protein